VACGLAKLGVGSVCYGIIGGDALGKWIKKELEKEGVDTGMIMEEKKLPSDLSAIIVDKESAERIIFSNQKVNGSLRVEEKKIQDCAWIFIGDLHGNWEENLDVIIQVAQKYKVKIAYNPRQSNIHDNPHKIIQAVAFADVLFLNKDEAKELIYMLDKSTDKNKLEDEIFLAGKLQEMGAKVVAITDGRRGAWAKEEKGTAVFSEGKKVEAVDSTGAGDAFSSGFLAAYVKNKNLKDCVGWGILNSAGCVTRYGGVAGLLSEKSISE
jgi:sugar/nucleoside kinase (ribokinase family)